MLNRDKYNDSLKYMPADFNELVIEGGNHAGFGSYGAQAGMGKRRFPRRSSGDRRRMRF